MRDGVTPAAPVPAVPVQAQVQVQQAPTSSPSPRSVGRYELLFELARGGMGAVWVGRLIGAHGFDRFVAIKVLNTISEDNDARRLFLEEAKVTARIHHPSVVQTLDLFEHEGHPFIVMELVHGVSLARLLGRMANERTMMRPELVAWIVMHAAAGLHAAHELRSRDGIPLELVHRDVSPQNILLSHDGRAYIADFGIAKVRRETFKTESGLVRGKFAYMSPEQVRGWPLDRRGDIFSLGVVFYEALTASRLYVGNAPAECAVQIVTGNVPDPRRVRPEISDALAAIVMRCLAKAPADRFQTADELRDELRRALHAMQSMSDEQHLVELMARWFKRDEDTLNKRLAEIEQASRAQGVLGAARADSSSQTPAVEIASGARTIIESDATTFDDPQRHEATKTIAQAHEHTDANVDANVNANVNASDLTVPVVLPVTKSPVMAIAIAFVMLIAIVAVVIVMTRSRSKSDVVDSTTTQTPPPPPSASSSSVAATGTGTTTPTETSAVPIASVGSSAKPSSRTTPRSAVPPKAPTAATATATATAATPPPSTAPSSAKGKLFNDL